MRLRRRSRHALALDMVFRAASAHRPIVLDEVLPMDCEYGNCDHDEDRECPTVSLVVCEACHYVAESVTEEYIPSSVLAENCHVCAAVLTYRQVATMMSLRP